MHREENDEMSYFITLKKFGRVCTGISLADLPEDFYRKSFCYTPNMHGVTIRQEIKWHLHISPLYSLRYTQLISVRYSGTYIDMEFLGIYFEFSDLFDDRDMRAKKGPEFMTDLKFAEIFSLRCIFKFIIYKNLEQFHSSCSANPKSSQSINLCS